MTRRAWGTGEAMVLAPSVRTPSYGPTVWLGKPVAYDTVYEYYLHLICLSAYLKLTYFGGIINMFFESTACGNEKHLCVFLFSNARRGNNTT